MTHFLPAAAISLGLIASTPPAFASESCAEQAAAIRKAQTAALDLKAERAALLEKVETAGETWEDAQTVRNFSSDHAARADTAKADYEELKAQLRALDTELQTKAARTNARVSAYNTNCANEG